MDDLTKRGIADRSRVNINQKHEVAESKQIISRILFSWKTQRNKKFKDGYDFDKAVNEIWNKYLNERKKPGSDDSRVFFNKFVDNQLSLYFN